MYHPGILIVLPYELLSLLNLITFHVTITVRVNHTVICTYGAYALVR